MTTTPQTRTVREWSQLLKTRQCTFTDLPADLQAIWLAGWAEADHDAEHRITQLTDCYDTALATAHAQAEQARQEALAERLHKNACRAAGIH
jgi:hypothetical protein